MNFHKSNKSESRQGIIEFIMLAFLVTITLIIIWGMVGTKVIETLGPSGMANIMGGIEILNR